MSRVGFGTSPENLSYSVFLDYARSNSPPMNVLDSVQRRVSTSWIPDSSVVACYACKGPFNIVRRRHHCRRCGRIFCGDCSNNFIVLPKNLGPFPEDPPPSSSWFTRNNTKQRVCNECHSHVTFIQSHDLEKYILGFVLSGLTLRDMASVSLVCRDWNRIANTYRSLFREIQYLLPTYPLSPIQRKILWVNADLLSGHSRWMNKLILSTDWSNSLQVSHLKQIYSQKKNYRCWNLMCTRLCCPVLTTFEILDLLDTWIPDEDIRKLLISTLDLLPDEEFDCCIPQFVFALRREIPKTTFLLDSLVRRSQNSIDHRTQIFWCLSVYRVLNPLFAPFYYLFTARLDEWRGKDVVYHELIMGRRFVKALLQLPSNQARAQRELCICLKRLDVLPTTPNSSFTLDIDNGNIL